MAGRRSFAYVVHEQVSYEPITGRLDRGTGPGDERICIDVGDTVLRLDVAAAVDLVDGVVSCLAQLEPGDAA
jgi:hypothetical protein